MKDGLPFGAGGSWLIPGGGDRIGGLPEGITGGYDRI